MFPFLPILFSEVNFTILHHKFTFLQIYCKVFSQFFLLEFVEYSYWLLWIGLQLEKSC